MKRNNRLINLLAAGNILALGLVTVMAFNGFGVAKVFANGSNPFGNLLPEGATSGIETVGMASASASTAEVALPESGNAAVAVEISTAASQNQFGLVQAQNQELLATLQLMEEREGQFQQLIADANEKILALEENEGTARQVYSTQNAELGSTVQTMQARELELQNRITTANQGIATMKNQLAESANNAVALQGQNSELVRVLQVMQERELQYQAQIEAANQALAQASGGYGDGGGEYYEDDDHGEYEEDEYEEDEYEEYEEDEYEEYEEEEDDDDDDD